jgi:hypothetical protein
MESSVMRVELSIVASGGEEGLYWREEGKKSRDSGGSKSLRHD